MELRSAATSAYLRLSIGRMNMTPDYLTLVVKRKNAGRVHPVAHDGFRYEPIADTVEDFIETMIGDRAKFLDEIGAFAFYSNVTSAVTWVSMTYHADLGSKQ